MPSRMSSAVMFTPLGSSPADSMNAAHRLDDGRPQPLLVGAALGGGDAVDVAADGLVGRLGPLQRRLDPDGLVLLGVERQRRGGGLAPVGHQLGQEVGDAALVLEHLLGARRLVAEGDLQALVQERLGVQPEADGVDVEVLLAEDLRVGPEVDAGAGAPGRPTLLQLGGRLAPLVGLRPLAAVALDGGDQLLRQRVHHAGARRRAGRPRTCTAPRRTCRRRATWSAPAPAPTCCRAS